ncbi:APC family permease [Thiohalophilus thiocyanatoxydans]|uniref:Amino acid/polyamine/organocation transporter (APC superfamily) n=1 Tax=Thiohalophilus thiocyanatoxydans TaxID=381308 RepID=A0A4R8IQ38_9GAMM|nr:APC family permease [Thiohalophilus thiocyanatoxydans]TDX99656.1 amino acid/polyamine/organocation transporter (APC superfamily) [Thiohalophilus thiocyanatoxydans]
MPGSDDRSAKYTANSLTLTGAVAMGTGVMIGAGIFALTGQVAELAREWFPLAFLLAAVISGFSAYSYIKLSRAWPSAGGIAMFLEKAYGKSVMTGACALLMYFSMVINESLVARTFGTYTLQLFDVSQDSVLVIVLGVGLLFFAFLINILSNRLIETFSFITAFIKIGGIVVFALGGLWVSGLSFESISVAPANLEGGSFLGAVALAILAYKGFTTITNSGGEIVDPHRNVGRAIVISIVICLVLYMLVTLAVGGNLSIAEIVRARDYALAEAARPAFGDYGLWFTVVFAIIATVSGVIASVFAVSRMLAMLTEMKLVPHSHFGMPGSIQKHTLVYTIVLAMLLTIFFDLSRIAALGAIFYIIMDMAVHWGILRHIRKQINANAYILITALILDLVVLVALLIIKAQTDMLVIYTAIVGLLLVFFGEHLFLSHYRKAT